MIDTAEIEQHRDKATSRAEYATTDVAASWYVAMRSTDLKREPAALKMFGQPLVAWRDGSGRPVIMHRYCSHQGASLAEGKVVDGHIQCPFHHWQFDNTGACALIPGHSTLVRRLEPIPRTARQSTYVTCERYGYIWVWYGTKTPLFSLPELPGADEGQQDGHMCLRFAYETRTSVLRIVENFYDAQHAAPVHELPISSFSLGALDDPRQSKLDVEALAGAGAWFGGEMEFHVDRYFGIMGVVSRLLGLQMSKMSLRFDGYPGGCIMTVLIDDEEKYKLLQCVTPVDKDETRLHVLITIKKDSSLLRSASNYVLFGLQTKVAAGYDVAIWNAMKSNGGGAYIKYDQLVLKYRAFYRSWVDKVVQEQPGRAV
ncbi:Rieske 2Fe-2S domain-containing protein [Sorangium sp. So ce854]|uniref:2Fe-2S ferredoxin n=1 Tax=Sorangium cellulosum TaxID=56 RepID=A0A150PA36_SORCE|nr:2Fe-2S ferredoxin [Sorangium cellulosum]